MNEGGFRSADRTVRTVTMLIVLIAMMAGTAMVAGAPTAGAAEQSEPARVTFVHGLQQVNADVYVGGVLVLSGVGPYQAIDNIRVPTGTYDLAVREAGAPSETTPLADAELEVTDDDELVDLVVHRSGVGEPTISALRNDLVEPAAATSRVSVRHLAQAGPLDVYDGRALVTAGLAAGRSYTLITTQPELLLDLTEPGEIKRLLDEPVAFALPAGSVVRSYVLGDLEEDLIVVNLGVDPTAVGGMRSDDHLVTGPDPATAADLAEEYGLEVPWEVPTGLGGLRSAEAGSSALAVGLIAVAGIGIAALGSRRLLAARR